MLDRDMTPSNMVNNNDRGDSNTAGDAAIIRVNDQSKLNNDMIDISGEYNGRKAAFGNSFNQRDPSPEITSMNVPFRIAAAETKLGGAGTISPKVQQRDSICAPISPPN